MLILFLFQVGDRQFVTDSGLMVPAISLQLRERLETAMLSHGISRYVPLIGHYRVYMASHWSMFPPAEARDLEAIFRSTLWLKSLSLVKIVFTWPLVGLMIRSFHSLLLVD